MQKEGYRPATIRGAIKTLKSVSRRTNLLNPEAIKDYLTKAEVSETRKVKICEDLSRFYQWKHIPFNKPKYRNIENVCSAPNFLAYGSHGAV